MSTLVSHKKRFVFIHLAKCAGTSVTSVLEPYAYPPLLSSKAIRNGVHILGHWLNIDLMNYTGQYILPLHANASTLARRFPGIDFASYFRFTVVRSPWARLVSSYEFNKRPRKKFSNPRSFYQQDDMSFADYVRTRIKVGSQPNQIDQLFTRDDGSLDMSFVAKLENLEKDMGIVFDSLGLDAPCIPQQNITNHPSYSRYYCDVTRSIVDAAFARDISAFGYTFGD